MRNITILFILIFSCLTSYSQSEKRAEKVALKCIKRTLEIVDKDIDYLLDASKEYTGFVSKMEIEKFEKKKNEVDSILRTSGFIKSGHLDLNLLKDCMQRSYDINNKKNDTTSCYYKLFKHVIYLSDNPKMCEEISATLHLGVIKSIITKDKENDPFYKAISFIMWHGFIVKPESIDESKTSLKNTSEYKPESNIEVLSIVEDEVEFEVILPVSKPKNNESFFVMVEKMPEFKGGVEALKKYLHVHSSEVKGKIYIQFVVDCNGRVANPRVIKGLTPLADEVAINLVKSMPQWTPGEQRGKKVNVQQVHPVIFD